MRKQILLMCDDLSFCRRFQEIMQDDTTNIQYFLTAADALDSYIRQRYCLVIMDSCLEDVDSQKLPQMMRRTKTVPILVLTNGLSIEEEINFFSLGATVCAQKPVELRHFIAQSRALVQFYLGLGHSEKRCYTLTFGMELTIDPIHRQVVLKGKWLELTRKEFDVLYFLASHPGQVFTREQIYHNVWHNEADYNVDESVKSSIKALRKKLTQAPKEYIQNVRGVGYRFAG